MSSKIIYLYVKTHRDTGLKYLGKTSSTDPYSYPGSGKYWQNHLKSHGDNCETTILKECRSNQEVKEWGIYYSNLWNVVESTEWANLKIEEGDGGRQSDEVRKKTGEKLKGRSPWNKGKTGVQTAWNKGLPSDEQPRFNKPGYWAGKSTWNKGKTGVQTAWNKGLASELNPLTGRPRPERTPEWSQRISEGNKGVKRPRPKVQCPHCGKVGDQSLMTRWHFDNCKVKTMK
jgi:hypothetical protein